MSYPSYSKLFYQCKPHPIYVETNNQKFIRPNSTIYSKKCTEMMLYPGFHQSLIEYQPDKQLDVVSHNRTDRDRGTYKSSCCGKLS